MRDTKKEILSFWFEETAPSQWFQKNNDFDAEIKSRFSLTYEMANKGLCAAWTDDAEGVLALCLVLDQFPRNMFRNSPKSFSSDKKILLIVKASINKGFDQLLSAHKRKFLYMPYMHSENLEDQKRSVELYKSLKGDDYLAYDYAVKHMEVIEKYGRFPHRNEALGRESTAEELEYLSDPNSGF